MAGRFGETCDNLDNDCNDLTDDVPAAQLAADVNHCGQCGKVCLNGQAWAQGKCGVAPFGDPTDKQTTQVSVTVTQVDPASHLPTGCRRARQSALERIMPP